MGRGLGVTQKAIMVRLRQTQEAVSIQDIAWTLARGDDDPERWDEWKRPSRSLLVGLRRAAKALEARGLVRLGYFGDWRSTDSRQLLVAWLPDVTPNLPGLERKRRKWAGADQAVLSVLEALTPEEVREWVEERYAGHRGYQNWEKVKPEWIPYQLLVKRAAALTGGIGAGGGVETNARRAVNKALERLAAGHQVELLGGDQLRKYRAIRCLVRQDGDQATDNLEERARLAAMFK